jgi:hypothetical protein
LEKEHRFEERISFYPDASELRAALLRQAMTYDTADTKSPPSLSYHFEPSGLASLLLSPHSRSSSTALADFMEWLSDWASDEISCEHTSRPQVRILLAGGARYREAEAHHRSHFFLALGPEKARYSGLLQLITRSSRSLLGKQVQYEHTEEVLLRFNSFILHEGDAEYLLKTLRKTFDPADSLMIVEGYLW